MNLILKKRAGAVRLLAVLCGVFVIGGVHAPSQAQGMFTENPAARTCQIAFADNTVVDKPCQGAVPIPSCSEPLDKMPVSIKMIDEFGLAHVQRFVIPPSATTCAPTLEDKEVPIPLAARPDPPLPTDTPLVFEIPIQRNVNPQQGVWLNIRIHDLQSITGNFTPIRFHSENYRFQSFNLGPNEYIELHISKAADRGVDNRYLPMVFTTTGSQTTRTLVVRPTVARGKPLDQYAYRTYDFGGANKYTMVCSGSDVGCNYDYVAEQTWRGVGQLFYQ
jgi:hypothetical protein